MFAPQRYFFDANKVKLFDTFFLNQPIPAMQTQQKFEPAAVRHALELLKDEDGIRWSEVAERVSAERGEDKRTMYQRLYRLLNGKRSIPSRFISSPSCFAKAKTTAHCCACD